MPDHLGRTQAALKGQFGAILVGQSETGKRCHRPNGARQIYEALKTQVEDGRQQTTRPASFDPRPCGRIWSLSTAITAAHEELLAEGFIKTRQGASAFILFPDYTRMDREARNGELGSFRVRCT